jgi:two-component system, sensor histidine kinase and response regulator
MRILLVDDSKLNQLLIQALLPKVDVSVTIANNGLEALGLVEGENVFDLVLMDIEMPEMDGREATMHIRKKLSYVDLPIIALTAHETIEEKQRCLDVGMNDVMTKPIDPEILYKILSAYHVK